MPPRSMSLVLLLLHAAATLYMVGLIWFVQLVHYPLAAQVGDDAFATYQQAHMSRTSLAVGPPMLVEATTTGLLLVTRPPGVPAWALWTGAMLLVGIWASTALLQVPLHQGLLQGHDPARLRQLVHSNWLRTVTWTARGGLATALIMWAWNSR